MSKMVPADIATHDVGPPPESNIVVDYDVKIEMVVLEHDSPRIILIPDQQFQITRVAPINAAERLGRVEPYPEVLLTVDLYQFHDDRLSRYLPSRVYWDGFWEKFVLLYYTSPMINMPPFGQDGTVFCCAFPLDPYSTYKYDVRARVFIDQIKVGDDMYCFMIFTTDSYDLLVSPKSDGISST